MKASILGGTLLVAAALAGCGSETDGETTGNTAPVETPTKVELHPGSGTVTPSLPTAKPTGSIDPTKAADRTACVFLANKVTASVYDFVDKGADREYPIVLTEESATPCSLTSLPAVELLDAAGKTVATAKPGTAGKPVLLTSKVPAQFTLTTPRSGATTATAKIRITLPHGGGTREIDSHGITVARDNVTVGAFTTRGAGG